MSEHTAAGTYTAEQVESWCPQCHPKPPSPRQESVFVGALYGTPVTAQQFQGWRAQIEQQRATPLPNDFHPFGGLFGGFGGWK